MADQCLPPAFEAATPTSYLVKSQDKYACLIWDPPSMKLLCFILCVLLILALRTALLRLFCHFTECQFQVFFLCALKTSSNGYRVFAFMDPCFLNPWKWRLRTHYWKSSLAANDFWKFTLQLGSWQLELYLNEPWISTEEEVPLVGLNSRVDIPCDIDVGLGFPHWILNDTTVYTLTSLLQAFPSFTIQGSVNHTLTIAGVTSEIDNTRFRCATLDGERLVLGSPTRISIGTQLL